MDILEKFGIRSSQMRGNDLIHNGGWYNLAGKKLGWGDLSDVDLKKISEVLEEGEVFLVLSEDDSHWAFNRFEDRGEEVWKVGSKKEADPGQGYVVSKARWALFKGEILLVTPEYDEDRTADGSTINTSSCVDRWRGLTVKSIHRRTLVSRLGIEPIDPNQIKAWLADVVSERAKPQM